MPTFLDDCFLPAVSRAFWPRLASSELDLGSLVPVTADKLCSLLYLRKLLLRVLIRCQLVEFGEDQGHNLREDVSICVPVGQLELMSKSFSHGRATAASCFSNSGVQIEHCGWIICQLSVPGHNKAKETAGLEEFLVDLIEERVCTGNHMSVSILKG